MFAGYTPDLAGRSILGPHGLEVPLTFCEFSLRQYLIGWRIRSRSRIELSTMDDHELWDMGMTRSSAKFEAAKPFWQE